MQAIKAFSLERKAHLTALILAVLMMLGRYTPTALTITDVPAKAKDTFPGTP